MTGLVGLFPTPYQKRGAILRPCLGVDKNVISSQNGLRFATGNGLYQRRAGDSGTRLGQGGEGEPRPTPDVWETARVSPVGPIDPLPSLPILLPAAVGKKGACCPG